LEEKLNSMKEEHNNLKKSENEATEKYSILKIDYEKVRFRSENLEALLGELEQQLLDTKNLLNEEIETKENWHQEKKELNSQLEKVILMNEDIHL